MPWILSSIGLHLYNELWRCIDCRIHGIPASFAMQIRRCAVNENMPFLYPFLSGFFVEIFVSFPCMEMDT